MGVRRKHRIDGTDCTIEYDEWIEGRSDTYHNVDVHARLTLCSSSGQGG
jgi:hypothetical protein